MIGAILQALYTHLQRLYLCYTVVLLVLLLLVGYLISPVHLYGTQDVVIDEGASITQSGRILKEHNIIRSVGMFRLLSSVLQVQSIHAGTYRFSTGEFAISVLGRLENGDTQIPYASITFPEGVPRYVMADLVEKQSAHITRNEFMKSSEGLEGYMFPDTYFLGQNTSADELVRLMRIQFNKKTQPLFEGMSSDEQRTVIILASIIEGEANTPTDRRIVAGILLERLKQGMRLQVDAPFAYAREERGYTPTAKDLESPTPYNTYRHAGLPPTPIGNPGVDALESVIHPTKTEYLYYITGLDGAMHYARTFAEHKKNITLYLK